MYKALLKQIRYGAFLGFCGGIASFVGPDHSGLLKAMMGIVIGAAILGDKLPRAIFEYYHYVKEIDKEIFGEDDND
jgi:hypothetical protein